MSLPCECCVLSGRGLFVGLISRPEESYRVWWAWVWSWSLDNENVLAHWGIFRHIKILIFCIMMVYYPLQLHRTLVVINVITFMSEASLIFNKQGDDNNEVTWRKARKVDPVSYRIRNISSLWNSAIYHPAARVLCVCFDGSWPNCLMPSVRWYIPDTFRLSTHFDSSNKVSSV